MSKKVIKVIIAIIILIIIGLVCIVKISLVGKNRMQIVSKSEAQLKTNKDNIYELFNNFPESNNIYYTSKSLYSERSIGPEIYQIDILAELTDKAYDDFIIKCNLKIWKNLK